MDDIGMTIVIVPLLILVATISRPLTLALIVFCAIAYFM